MIKLNIHEAKTNLSKYLTHLRRGGVVILCKRNEPVAEIRGIERRQKGPRPVGLEAGRLTVPKSFFDPLPTEFIKSFDANA